VWSLALAGCNAEPRRASEARSSSTAAAHTEPAASAAASPPAPDAAGSIIVDVAARAACDTAARAWSTVVGATVRRIDTVVTPGDAIGDSVIAERDAGTPVAACLVEGRHPSGIDSATSARLAWRAADGQRGRNGWGALWRLEASGPEGSLEVYQRGRTRCDVSVRFDGGDDGDSTYVPDPFFAQSIVCWQHPRALLPVDTAILSP
jgi:hypothetical protein